MLFDKRSGHVLFCPPLYANQLFGGLSEYGRNSLGALMKAKCFRAGEQVFSSGEVPAHIYILNRGRANLTREHSRKMSAPTRPVEPDQLFGVIEVLADHHFEPCLVAATPCDFQVIERADFVAFLEVRPDVCFRFVTVISSLYRDAVTRLKTG